MYCTRCNGLSVANCRRCGKYVCRSHRRRWLLLSYCRHCYKRKFPQWLLLLPVLLVAGYLLWQQYAQDPARATPAQPGRPAAIVP